MSLRSQLCHPNLGSVSAHRAVRGTAMRGGLCPPCAPHPCDRAWPFAQVVSVTCPSRGVTDAGPISPGGRKPPPWDADQGCWAWRGWKGSGPLASSK